MVREGAAETEGLDRTDDIFWTLFRASRDPMILCRLSDGTYFDVNDAFVKLLGRPRNTILGQPVPMPAHWSPEDGEAAIARLRSEGTAGPFDIPMVVGPGEVKSCSFSAVVLEIEGEVFSLATLRDETELRQAQEEAREREQRLEMLVDGMPGVMWTTDDHLRLQTLQGAGLRGMPFEAENLIGKSLLEMMGPEAERYRDEMEAPLGGSPSFFEATLEGHVLSVFCQPLQHDDGTRGTMGAAIDVTRNRRAEEELKHTADRLRSLNDLARTIASARSPEDVARVACERVRSLISCSRASISMFDAETGLGRLAAVHADGPTELRAGYEFSVAALGPLGQLSTEGISFDDLAAMEKPREPYTTLIQEGIRAYLVTPLIVDDRLIGLLSVGSPEPGSLDEGSAEVAREVAALVAVAFHQSRLRARADDNAGELEIRLEQLRETDAERRRLLAQVVRTQEEERRRISNDIHDDSVQKMAAVGLRLDAIRHYVDEPDVLAQIDQLSEVVSLSIGRLRRLMFELWPPDLERYGLAAAIRADLLAQRDDFAIEFSLVDQMTEKVPLEERIIAYRIVQEALSNVRKHSGARSVEIALSTLYGGVHVTVADDGHGLRSDVKESPPGHLGLTSMRERAELVGGWLKISNRKPRGARVEFFIPAVETTTDTEADARNA